MSDKTGKRPKKDITKGISCSDEEREAFKKFADYLIKLYPVDTEENEILWKLSLKIYTRGLESQTNRINNVIDELLRTRKIQKAVAEKIKTAIRNSYGKNYKELLADLIKPETDDEMIKAYLFYIKENNNPQPTTRDLENGTGISRQRWQTRLRKPVFITRLYNEIEKKINLAKKEEVITFWVNTKHNLEQYYTEMKIKKETSRDPSDIDRKRYDDLYSE